jgi:ankyrin repeat protein
MVSCRWGRKELAELLIARGAPINEPDAEPRATPVAWAEKMGHSAVLEVLREHQRCRDLRSGFVIIRTRRFR